MSAATVTNLRTYDTGAGGVFPDNSQAQGSLAGESNERHVIIAIGVVAAVVILAGVVNFRLRVGRGGE